MADDSRLRQYLLKNGPQLNQNFESFGLKSGKMDEKLQELISKPHIGGASAQGLVYLDDLEQKATEILLNKCQAGSCTVEAANETLHRNKVLAQYLFANDKVDGVISFVLRHPGRFFVWGDRIYAANGHYRAPKCDECEKLKEYVPRRSEVIVECELDYYRSTKSFAKYMHPELLNTRGLFHYEPKRQHEISTALSAAYITSIVQQQAMNSCSISSLVAKIKKASVQIFNTIFPQTCSAKSVQDFVKNCCQPGVTIEDSRVVVPCNTAWDSLCAKAVQAQFKLESLAIAKEKAEHLKDCGNMVNTENRRSGNGEEPDESAEGEWETAGRKLRQRKESLSSPAAHLAHKAPVTKPQSTKRKRRKQKQSKHTTTSTVTLPSPEKASPVVSEAPTKDKCNKTTRVPRSRPPTPTVAKNEQKLSASTKSRGTHSPVTSPALGKPFPATPKAAAKKIDKTTKVAGSRPPTPNNVNKSRRGSTSRATNLSVTSREQVVTKKTVMAPWIKPANHDQNSHIPHETPKFTPKVVTSSQSSNLATSFKPSYANSLKVQQNNERKVTTQLIGNQRSTKGQGQMDLTPKRETKELSSLSSLSPPVAFNHAERKMASPKSKAGFEVKQTVGVDNVAYNQPEKRIESPTAKNLTPKFMTKDSNPLLFPSSTDAIWSPKSDQPCFTGESGPKLHTVVNNSHNASQPRSPEFVFTPLAVNVPIRLFQVPVISGLVGNSNRFVSPLHPVPKVPSLVPSIANRFIVSPPLQLESQTHQESQVMNRFSNLGQQQQRGTFQCEVLPQSFTPQQHQQQRESLASVASPHPFAVQRQQPTQTHFERIQQRESLESVAPQPPRTAQQQPAGTQMKSQPTIGWGLDTDPQQKNASVPPSQFAPQQNQLPRTQTLTKKQQQQPNKTDQAQPQHQTKRQSSEELTVQLAKQLQDEQKRQQNQQQMKNLMMQQQQAQEERNKQLQELQNIKEQRANIRPQEHVKLQKNQNLVLPDQKEQQKRQQTKKQQPKHDMSLQQPMSQPHKLCEEKQELTKMEEKQPFLNLQLKNQMQLRMTNKQQSQPEKKEQTMVPQQEKGFWPPKINLQQSKHHSSDTIQRELDDAPVGVPSVPQNPALQKEVKQNLTKEERASKTPKARSPETVPPSQLPNQKPKAPEIFINPSVKLIQMELEQQEDRTLHVNVLFVKCLDTSEGEKFRSVNDLNSFINNFGNVFSNDGGLVQIRA